MSFQFPEDVWSIIKDNLDGLHLREKYNNTVLKDLGTCKFKTKYNRRIRGWVYVVEKFDDTEWELPDFYINASFCPKCGNYTERQLNWGFHPFGDNNKTICKC